MFLVTCAKLLCVNICCDPCEWKVSNVFVKQQSRAVVIQIDLVSIINLVDVLNAVTVVIIIFCKTMHKSLILFHQACALPAAKRRTENREEWHK